MKRLLKNGTQSVILRFFLQDSASTVGAGKTGLGIASAGLIISTLASNEAAPTVYTAAGSTIETIATLGAYAAPTATKCRFKEVDSTNMPGLYEVQLADARFAVSNARTLLISIIATGIAPVYAECELVAYDPLDAAGLGLSLLDATISSRASQTGQDTLAGYVDTEVAAIKAKTDNLPASPAATSDIPSAASIAAAVWATTLSALAAVPAITGTAKDALAWLFTLARNKRTQTSTAETVFADDGSTTVATSAKSDDGTTFTRSEYS